MIIVNRIGEMINISCNGEDKSVAYSKKAMEKLIKISEQSEEVSTMEELNALSEKVEKICSNVVSEMFSDIHEDLFKDPKTGSYHLRLSASPEVISSVAMPEPLVRRIEESIEKQLSIDPLMKCWVRFLRNNKANNSDFAERFFQYIDMKYVSPAIKSEKMKEGFSDSIATEMATVYQVKITKEGLVNCYKISTEVDWKYELNQDGEPVRKDRYQKTFDETTGEITGDNRDEEIIEKRLFMPAVMGDRGDKFYCGSKLGHIIKVGEVHRLEDWSMVNCDDHTSCVKGLHVGGLDYIAHYSGEIHNVFVDPMNIGAIPDSNTGAMRVLEYFVHSSMVAVNTSIYHSSKYGSKTDSDWDDIKKELFIRNKEVLENNETSNAELKAL